jgi:hypothetical protein
MPTKTFSITNPTIGGEILRLFSASGNPHKIGVNTLGNRQVINDDTGFWYIDTSYNVVAYFNLFPVERAMNLVEITIGDIEVLRASLNELHIDLLWS